METLKKDGSAIQQDASNVEGADTTRIKECTGTYFFMAMELINPRSNPLHCLHHDLESYYWVLLWVVLRHTRSFTRASGQEKSRTGKQVCARLFNCDNAPLGFILKQSWVIDLDEPPLLEITGNVPLTTLVTEFKALLRRQLGASLGFTSGPVENQRLTHANVLEVFDRALEMDGWPDGDWVACDIGKDPRTGMAPILRDTPTGYPEILTDERVLRSNPLSRSLTDAAIEAGSVASRGHLPTPLAPAPLPTPFSSGGSQIASGSSLKRRSREDDQFPQPSEVPPTVPKRSKSTMGPPPPPNAVTAEFSSQAAIKSRGTRSDGVPPTLLRRSSERIAAKRPSGDGPSGTA